MLQLPNNCRASKLSVYPSNYLSDDADVSLVWYIKYRFYNEAFPQGKQIVLKTMNRCKNLSERQEMVLQLVRHETHRLYSGYDPTLVVKKEDRVTLFQALRFAVTKLTIAGKTKTEMEGMVRRIQNCNPGYDPFIKEVTRKHIRRILDSCYSNPKFSDNTFNHYRKYLRILFNYLVEIEYVETNYVRDISTKPTVSRLREILSDKEFGEMQVHLFNNYYTFWRFVMIFLYSGARIVEVLKLRRQDVNLTDQYFKVTIRKGKKAREVLKVIPTKVLPLWKELLSEDGDYLFSKGLKPGAKAVRSEQIERRWRTHVKEKLGIDIDIYSLKHLYLDSIESHLGLKTASTAADHTSEYTTRRYYTVGKDQRIREQLKNFEI